LYFDDEVCLPHRQCNTAQHNMIPYIRKKNKRNKKHLKNTGPIRHNEPPHAHSPDVASGTVARRLHIDVHDIDNDDSDNA